MSRLNRRQLLHVAGQQTGCL